MDDLPKGAELLIDGAMGIYLPQRFVCNYVASTWHVKPIDAAVLQNGPDDPLYWEVWDDVINYAWIEKDGKVWNLWQDGDLWAYCQADQQQDGENED